MIEVLAGEILDRMMPRKPTFQLNLRSLLAITFGVSLVMAVASPWLKGLDTDQYRVLGFALITCCGGAIGGAIYSIKSRASAVQQAGRLLLAIPISSETRIQYARWLTLLLLAPAMLWNCYVMLERVGSPNTSVFYSLLFTLFAIYFGWIIGNQLVCTWAEGFGDSIQLCENGIVIVDQYYSWSSPNIKDLFTRKLKMELEIQFKRRYGMTLKLNEKQYEQAREILSARYQRPSDAYSLG